MNLNLLLRCGWGVLFAVGVLIKAQAAELNFVNFDYSHSLPLAEGQSSFVIKQTPDHLVYADLSNRLIIKSSLSLKSQVLRDRVARLCGCAMSMKTLYEGYAFNYYLAEFLDIDQAVSLVGPLLKQEGIQLVQPDVLLYRRAAGDHFKNNAADLSYFDILRLPELWRQSKGRGVKIAVIDDGFDLSHPDLSHIDLVFSYDVDQAKLSEKPYYSVDVHGTRLLGLIYGAHNQAGPHGMVPEAGLIAIRQTKQWTSQTILALSVAEKAGADVINCSWVSEELMQPVKEVVDDLAMRGRNGKGIAVVFAAGNRGKLIVPNSSESAIESAIVVGSLQGNGRRAKFSGYGSSVDVYFPGTGLLTTTQNDRYAIYRGTSYSAALVSGYIALLISLDDSLALTSITKSLQAIDWL